jgi:excisionase family DNA binding protein
MAKTTIETIYEQVITKAERDEMLDLIFKPEIKNDAYYLYREVQRALGISLSTITRAVQKGHLKAVGIGSEPRLKGSDIHAWINAGGKTGRNARDFRRGLRTVTRAAQV